MNKLLQLIAALALGFAAVDNAAGQSKPAENPIIWADVPDMAMMRVGDTYYMSSTTMHLSTGLPIMKSKDLVNWQLVDYAYRILGDHDALTLQNGRNAYGAGSWASSLRYHQGTYSKINQQRLFLKLRRNNHENNNSSSCTSGQPFGHGPDKPAGGGGFQAVVAESARQTVSSGQL